MGDGRCGAWTIRAADAFEKTHSQITHPMLLMLTGQVKVKGFRNMGRFGRLMAFPGRDVVVSPMRERL